VNDSGLTGKRTREAQNIEGLAVGGKKKGKL
jgi:hypothetical protein